MKKKLLTCLMGMAVFVLLLPSAWAAAPEPKAVEKLYAVMDPRGNQLPAQRVPLTTNRPKSLDGKTVYVLGNERSDFLMPLIAEYVKGYVPGAKVEFRRCPTNNCETLAEFDLPGDIVEKKANAMITGMVH